jgi:hypothetical protein
MLCRHSWDTHGPQSRLCPGSTGDSPSSSHHWASVSAAASIAHIVPSVIKGPLKCSNFFVGGGGVSLAALSHFRAPAGWTSCGLHPYWATTLVPAGVTPTRVLAVRKTEALCVIALCNDIMGSHPATLCCSCSMYPGGHHVKSDITGVHHQLASCRYVLSG